MLSSSISLHWPPFIQRTASDILTDYGPFVFGNRPVRTRTPGGVGAGGEKPPATRLGMIGFSPLSESPGNPLITASSARTRPSPGIHACKRRSARVPRLVGLEHLLRTRRRDCLQAIGAWGAPWPP